MPTIDRVRIALTGFPGGPGVCTFYGISGSSLLPPLHQLWDDLRGTMPVDVGIAFPASGDTIDTATGQIMGSWAGTQLPAWQGVATGGYAAPVGVALTWLTSARFSGRLLKGRSFIVPMISTVFDVNGSLLTAQLQQLEVAAALMVSQSAGNFVIWQRPRKAGPAVGTRPPVTARGGGYAVVTSSRVADKAAILRSRRD